MPIVIGALGTVTKKIIKGPGGLESWWTCRDSIAEDGQNPETSPGDLRGLAVTQTPVKNHQLILMWKTLEEYNNDDDDSKLDVEIKKKLEDNAGKE